MANNYKGNKNKNVKKKVRYRSETDNSTRNKYAYDERCNEASKTNNDVSWYTRAGKLVHNAGNISFFNPVGSINAFNSKFSFLHKFAFPGIMTLDILPIPGLGSTNSSALNIAARNIYTFIRHANSGAKNYDAPDLMLYLLSMDSLYMAWADMVRAYGVARLYSQTNRYYPLALLRALGYNADPTDPDSILNNLSDFRMFINEVATRVAAFSVPANMSYFQRHAWLFSNVFIDHPETKAQIYAYKPAAFWKYVETEGAGKLEPIVRDETVQPAKFSEIVQSVSTMVDTVMESEDMGIMMGDILKAYGRDKLIALDHIDENFTVIPVFNPEVLEQIQNATVLPSDIDWTEPTISVTQNVNTGALVFSPEFKGHVFNGTNPTRDNECDRMQLYAVDGANFLNLHQDDPSPENVMVATRLHLCGAFISGTPSATAYKYQLRSAGTEIVTKLYVYQYEDVNGTPTLVPHRVFGVANYGSSGALEDIVNLITHFDWHPMIMAVELDTTNHVISHVCQIIETDNYTFIDPQVMENLHSAAVLSEFDVPLMGTAE